MSLFKMHQPVTIYYDSKTGNVKRFIEKIRKRCSDWELINITEAKQISEYGHLITFTTKIGCVAETTELFLKKYSKFILSVSSSGNQNWGIYFAVAADIIAKEYSIPIFLKFELSGLDRDVEAFINKVKNHADKKMDSPQQ